MGFFRKILCFLLLLPLFFGGSASGYWDGELEAGEDAGVAVPTSASAVSTSAVTFSRPGGLYTEGFDLTLTTDAGLQIWFTTNGSDPLPGVRGTRYTGPIRLRDRSGEPNVLAAIPFAEIGVDWQVSLPSVPAPTVPVQKATVIRAQAFDASGNSVGGIATHSFFIMPDIHTRYVGLPIISLVTHSDNFFHINHGLYMNGLSPVRYAQNWAQRGGEWERPVSMELFETDGSLALATDIGVRIHGGSSRFFPQKSLRLYARSDGATRFAAASNTGPTHRQGVRYFNGVSDFNADLFQGAAVDSRGNPVEIFRNLILRNAGQDATGAFFRDAMLQRLAGNLNVATQAYRPVVVYLNGEFWGLYNLRERWSGHYFRNHFGIHQNNLSLLEIGYGLHVSEGANFNADDYRNLMQTIIDGDLKGSADNTLYQWVQEQMCIDSYIDHFAIGVFFVNRDWPHNNQRLWRYVDMGANDPNPDRRITDGRWRWVLHDLDFSTKILGWPGAGWDFNHLGILLGPPDPRGPSLCKFRSLMENDDFRYRFINRTMDLMNTHLSETPFHAAINTAAARIAHVIPEQAARWQNITKQSWQAEVGILRDFASNRHGAMRQHMQEHFNLGDLVTLSTHVNTAYGRVAVNGLVIDPAETQGVTDASRWVGTYFAGMTQRIEAIPAAGETLIHFLVNGSVVRANANNTIFLTLMENTLVIPVFSLDPGHITCPLANTITEARPIRPNWNSPQPGHTPASWAVFRLALTEAERVFADPNATPAQRATASALLREAMSGLELVVLGCSGSDSERHPAYMFGVGRGSGAFAPRDNISRAEVAAILVRTQLSGFEPVNTLPPGMDAFDAFTDVNESNWFYYYVAWAHDAGLVMGDRGRFRPNDQITREQFAAMLARTTSGEIDSWGLSVLTHDAEAVSDWAGRYVGLIYHLGWMVGDNHGNFNPRDQITRGEVATAVNRILGRVACRETLAAADIENQGSANQFPDVAETAWYFPAVLGAGNDHSLIRNGTTGAVNWMRIVVE